VALVQLTPPAAEPLTVAEAKNHLRIDSDITQDDALIGILISAARKYGEMVTGRSWITQQWRMVLDGFYSNDYGIIELDRGIVQSVDSITYLDTSSVSRAMDLSVLAKDFTSMPARISPVFGTVWPISLPQIGAVQINYTAGYGAASSFVPEGIRQWMLVRLTTLYEHREEVEIVARGKIEPMPFIDGLLDPYKVLTL
jgi:uncharacterized phiE125 gp8 family phage protein